jgi:peptidoglycan hydrolase CwlO-like protein
MARLIVVLSLALACASCMSQEEIQQQLAAEQHQRCTAAGFPPTSDSYRLCLLIEGQNQRIDALQRQVQIVQTDIRQLLTVRPYIYNYKN